MKRLNRWSVGDKLTSMGVTYRIVARMHGLDCYRQVFDVQDGKGRRKLVRLI